MTWTRPCLGSEEPQPRGSRSSSNNVRRHPQNGKVIADDDMDRAMAYCYDRGGGQYTSLVPVDRLPLEFENIPRRPLLRAAILKAPSARGRASPAYAPQHETPHRESRQEMVRPVRADKGQAATASRTWGGGSSRAGARRSLAIDAEDDQEEEAVGSGGQGGFYDWGAQNDGGAQNHGSADGVEDDNDPQLQHAFWMSRAGAPSLQGAPSKAAHSTSMFLK
ncbi:hypothetical protein F5883DRAFT_635011 [Diaporthe sp. PMI_573]|nr:hypothetical protein F5883DRAFT_635011 [Diaporthaceae sp. PMI_573]